MQHLRLDLGLQLIQGKGVAMRSLRDLFRRLPESGKLRHALRSFNTQMMGANSPPSVLELAMACGISVVLRPLPTSVRGQLARDPFEDSGFVIEVNEADDVRTRRWTVLHELMHWLLQPRPDPLAEPQFRAGGAHFYSGAELREEREVDEFVEALIFGDGALAAALDLFGDDHDALARHFGVSRPTLFRALRRL